MFEALFLSSITVVAFFKVVLGPMPPLGTAFTPTDILDLMDGRGPLFAGGGNSSGVAPALCARKICRE